MCPRRRPDQSGTRFSRSLSSDKLGMCSHADSQLGCPSQMQLQVSFTLIVSATFTTSVGAQSLVVQQPVVAQSMVRTAVSVPNHGSTLLGSISSAQSLGGSSRTALPSSQQVRSVRRGSTVVGVFIHDFEETDRALLATADVQASPQRRSRPTEMAARARQIMLKRHAAERCIASGYAADGAEVRRFGSRTLP